MAFDPQGTHTASVIKRAQENFDKEVAAKQEQARRNGWETPLDHRPMKFHLGMAEAFEKELKIAKRNKAKQERYKSVHGHYPRYSVMGQGR